MKLSLFLNFILIIAVWPAFSQTDYADSLKRANLKLPENKEKADNYYLLAKHYRSIDRDSTLLYCEKAYNLAYSLNYTPVCADAMYTRSLILSEQDEYEEAMALNEHFIRIADSMGDAKRLAKGYYSRGTLHSNLLEYEKALEFYGRSLPAYLELNDTLGILANYNAIGRVFMSRSVFDSASVYFMKSVELCEKAGASQEKNLTSVLSNLAEIYFQLGQFEDALKYKLRSQEINRKFDRPAAMASDYNMIGRIYSEMGRKEEALECYEKARELFVQVKDTVSISNVMNNVGVIYREMGDYNRAIESYENALEGYIKKDYTRGIVVAYGNIGVALSMLGRYQEAIAMQEKVAEMAYSYDLPEYRMDALENMSWYWMKLGNYRNAYDYQIRYNALKDSLFDIDKTKMINELTLKYEQEKNEAQILELEKTNLQKDLSLKKRTIQRNAYLFAGIGLTLIALFLVLYLRQRARKDKIIAEQQIHQLEEEKKLLAAKMIVEGQEEERKRIARELHDGLGVLLSATKMQFTSIRDTSPENKPLIERATQLLEQASGDVRKISHNMMPGLLTKLGLYEALEDLIDNLNDSGKIKGICDIPEDLARLPENQEIMVYRIAQELVNNSLKHAAPEEIRLEISPAPGAIEIRYSDDGKGFDPDKLTDEGGMGMKSIRSRVDFLNGNMDLHTSPGQGVKYLIRIPVTA